MPVRLIEDNRSVIDRWRDDGVLAARVAALREPEVEEFFYLWRVWARRNQLTPRQMGAMFRVWFFRGGRGSGKTRSGAETCRERVERGARRIGLVGPTAGDIRDVMIEGESGLLSVFPRHQRPDYQPSLRRITFHTGAIGTTYSADEPDRLRGPQHEWAWGDEPASWKSGKEAFDNLMFGMRLGRDPWVMLTGTPKVLPWLREIENRPDTITTTGSTFDNERYLAETFIADMRGRYEGTRLGLQELFAEYLDEIVGALWTEPTIDRGRMARFDMDDPWGSLNEWLVMGGEPMFTGADLRRPWKVIVSVDPPGETAECGIVVSAAPSQSRAGRDHAVILEDCSLAGRPEEWGQRVVEAYRRWGAALVVVEKNQGGDMTRSTIHAVDNTVRVKKITAVSSKAGRAMPVSALYERGLVHHVGHFPMLELQQTTWIPQESSQSPDRLDALVHGVNHHLPAPVRSASRIGRAPASTLA